LTIENEADLKILTNYALACMFISQTAMKPSDLKYDTNTWSYIGYIDHNGFDPATLLEQHFKDFVGEIILIPTSLINPDYWVAIKKN
jgi:hypothetical protein